MRGRTISERSQQPASLGWPGKERRYWHLGSTPGWGHYELPYPAPEHWQGLSSYSDLLPILLIGNGSFTFFKTSLQDVDRTCKATSEACPSLAER